MSKLFTLFVPRVNPLRSKSPLCFPYSHYRGLFSSTRGQKNSGVCHSGTILLEPPGKPLYHNPNYSFFLPLF